MDQHMEWLKEEDAAIKCRREACKWPNEKKGDPQWGLAFSGGGIRSATFCLGLAKSLAENKLLGRFDYLSTVSGGGYAGSAIGRLFQHVNDPAKVQSGLANDDTLFYWWLRKNGRYLFPAGVKDMVFAGATMLRGLIAIHFELLLLGLVLCGILFMPHILGLVLPAQFQDHIIWANSAWWLPVSATPLLLMVAIWSYWFIAEHPTKGAVLARIVFSIAGLIAGLLLLSEISVFAGLSFWIKFVAAQVAFSIPIAILFTRLVSRQLNNDFGAIRNRLTRELSTVLTVTAALVAAALLDVISWTLALVIDKSLSFSTAGAGGGGLVGLLLVVRGVMQWLKDRPGAKAPGINLQRLANTVGIVLALAFLVMCATFLQWILFLGGTVSQQPGELATTASERWLVVMLPCLFFILATGRSMSWLNSSSLHNFYRARLTRSYVSVANPTRGFVPNALTPATEEVVEGLRRVSDVVPADDIALASYAPHAHGGPIHLINTCLNQTIDDHTQEFNLDRNGTILTASSLGYDLGNSMERIKLAYQNEDEPFLGQWVAISGAAASPGMGANTSRGLASLLTLCGIRLGYWLDLKSRNGKPLITSTFWHAWLPKYRHLLDELMARFPGSIHPHWYLSDGGHFENTAIYALLKREVSFIVAADCGADPGYGFGDLDNLIRLARIDLSAEITFLRPGDNDKDKDKLPVEANVPTEFAAFGTLRQIAGKENSACLVLAHIQYASGASGYLLIVKPTMTNGLPYDLVSYHAKYNEFPQQPTADQFFDEAQWESYFRLGQELGGQITATLAETISGLPRALADLRAFSAYSGVGVVIPEPLAAASTRTGFSAEVVKSSLGIGAAASLVISVWQMWDQQRVSAAADRMQYDEVLRKALDKSVDTKGNLQLNDATLLYLKSVVKPASVADEQDGKIRWINDWVSQLETDCKRESVANEGSKKRCEELKKVRGYISKQSKIDTRDYWMTAYRESAKPKATPVANGAPPLTAIVTTPVVESKSAGREVAGNLVSDPQKGVAGVPKPVAVESASAMGGRGVPESIFKGAPGMVMGGGTKAVPPPAPPPPPRPTPAPAQMSGPAPAAVGPCKAHEDNVHLYTQVYDQTELQQLNKVFTSSPFKERFLSGAVEVERIENVVSSAEESGRRPPFRWKVPTFIYHADSDAACAEALKNAYQSVFMSPEVQVRPLPARLIKQAGTIELWVPPGGAVLKAAP